MKLTIVFRDFHQSSRHVVASRGTFRRVFVPFLSLLCQGLISHLSYHGQIGSILPRSRLRGNLPGAGNLIPLNGRGVPLCVCRQLPKKRSLLLANQKKREKETQDADRDKENVRKHHLRP